MLKNGLKLVTFAHAGLRRHSLSLIPSVGALTEKAVVDLSPIHKGTMKEFLRGGEGALARATEFIGSSSAKSHKLEDVQLLAPIDDPEKIICIGLNYSDHAEESGMALPEQPIMFSKVTATL